MQDCGGCIHFIKWKFDRFGGGLCEIKDARTKTDHGRRCKEHTPPKYDRHQQKQCVNKVIALENSEA